MSPLDAILNRRSIRRYSKEKVPEKVMKNILEAGRLAPTANNAQPWHFIVVTDHKVKQSLSTGNWNSFIKDSSFTVVGCGDKDNEWSTVDVTIALQNMVIAAEAEGVGSCWVGDFKEKELRDVLGIPDNLDIICQVSFGYPDEKPRESSKKSLNEIVHYNKF